MKYLLSIILLIGASGCSSLDPHQATKWGLIGSIPLSYFGTVAIHEGGHALSAELLGGKNIRVSVLPEVDDGVLYLGRTTIESTELSRRDISIFNTMGPTANFGAHIGSRALLRSGKVPKLLQPTLGWFSLFNRTSYYHHILMGITRNKNKDLGKEDRWISYVMLAGGLAFDILDMFTDSHGRYFGVLIGNEFYEESSDPEVSLLSSPMPGGGFLGIGFSW